MSFLPLERCDTSALDAEHGGDGPVHCLEGIGDRIDGGVCALFDDLGVVVQLSELLL